MNVREIGVKDYLTKSNLPESDFVINPYIGCIHGCRYCYAEFMKRFTNHTEPWGDFIDIKTCDKKINLNKIKNKVVFLSSVTDCYNPLEKKYGITRNILQQLQAGECEVNVSTKSHLILRDIDILSKMPNVKAAISLNTLEESFRSDMDRASSIQERLAALKTLHKNHIYTVLFISPIFPEITRWQDLVEITQEYVDEIWFENLNLRGGYKNVILSYIMESYQQYYPIYKNIFIDKNMDYWKNMEAEISSYCDGKGIKYQSYFHHNQLVAQKKEQYKAAGIRETNH